MTTFTHIIVMLFDREEEGEEEMRGIIDYFGEKSFVIFITHAGNIYVRIFANSRQKDRQRKIKQTDSKNNTARHSVRQPN